MKIVEQHLVMCKAEVGTNHTVSKVVVVIFEERSKKLYYLETPNGYKEINKDKFKILDNDLQRVVNGVDLNKILIWDWINKTKNPVSVRLRNILLSCGYEYIEELKPEDVRKFRNIGRTTFLEFLKHRNQDNPQGLFEDLLKYRNITGLKIEDSYDHSSVACELE